MLDCIRRRQAAKRIKVKDVVQRIESCRLLRLWRFALLRIYNAAGWSHGKWERRNDTNVVSQ